MKKWILQMLMNIASGFLGKLLATFVLIIPVVASSLEYVQQGKLQVPMWAWVVSAVFIILLGTSWLIVRRGKFINALNKKHLPLIAFIPSGWEDLGVEEWSDVLWRVRIPAKLPSRNFMDTSPAINLDKIDVQTPPLCKECETELEELNSFWGKYIWNCVGCGFNKKSKLSFFEAADNAKKRIKGKMRLNT